MRNWLLAILMVLCWSASHAAAEPPRPAFEVAAKGFVTDGTHPMRPGDFTRLESEVRVKYDPAVGEGEIAIKPRGRTGATWFVRRGRVFQCDADGKELPPSGIADLSAATIAALHPELVEAALAQRPELVANGSAASQLLAWNDELWNVTRRADGTLSGLSRRTHDDVRGAGVEEIAYEAGRVMVSSRGREIANLKFAADTTIDKYRTPAGDPRRDRTRLVPPEEMTFKELAAGVFAVEMPSANSRMIVAEFADHLFIFEGAYTSGNCDMLAAKVEERFRKPVRYFAFSHIHGQYVGGVRSWVRAGATVLAPPSTVPLVQEAADADFSLRPDALSRHPTPLNVQVVEERWAHEDAANAVVVCNTPNSEHTNEYLLVYFPRQKLLLTGDLLFLTPGQPLKGRSLRLYQTIGELGLDVELAVPTWPLQMAGIKNLLTGDELRAAAGK